MPVDLPPPDPALEISLATNGYSKGLAQTDGPQLLARGEIGLGHLFVRGYWKNVSSPVLDGEAGVQFGARVSAGDLRLEAAVAYKRSTGIDGATDGDAFELAIAASQQVGPATPRLTVAYSPDELGATGESLFVEAGAGVPIADLATLSAHLGRRERRGGSDYTSFNVGLSRELTQALGVDLRYYDTAESALGEIYEGRLVLTVRLRF